MAAPKNFVAGFNHNIKHRGQVFHVQTEDSGSEIAVISTHLFVGGTILASRRSSYGDLAGAADLQAQVRVRMEAQHKQVLRDLVNGDFESKLRGLPSYQPGQLADTPTGRPPVTRSVTPPVHVTRFDNGVVGGAAAPRPGNVAVGAPLHLQTPGPPAARALAATPGPARPIEPLQAHAASPGPARTISAIEPPPDLRTPGPAQPVRHAASLGAFGADVISDKSLDQVILAYLAGETDE
ncbi:hypothetical protein [Vulgatibacter sp.]|uniref:hypothetical protein n=1 Tax=Vulgatibacter sp. TaxID=1971226 RepID=UPI0035637EF4